MEGSGDEEQCQAITNAGTRCSRLAKDGRFCFQHDETDETVDDEELSSAGYVSIISDQFESASVQLSGASQDVAENIKDIVDEAGSVAEAIQTGDLEGTLQNFSRTVGKTAPTAGKGALIGAVLSSPFGPIGVATGATVGGWYGVYRSLDDDRAVAASIAKDIPDDADIVSSQNSAIADVEPIQMAIRSAVETDEEEGSEWLRSTLIRERDMNAVADAIDQIPAYEAEDEATQYFIRDEETGEVLLLIFGVPKEGN